MMATIHPDTTLIRAKGKQSKVQSRITNQKGIVSRPLREVDTQGKHRMSSPKPKRLPRATLEQKIMVLDHYHRSQRTQAYTVEHFRHQIAISTSSISEWLKEETSLRAQYNDSSGQFRYAKRKLKFKYEQINREMDEMVRTRKKAGEPITEPVMREHWRLYAAQYGVEDPKRLQSFSHGWLAQFKKRHGLDNKSKRERLHSAASDPNGDKESDEDDEDEDEDDADDEEGDNDAPPMDDDMIETDAADPPSDTITPAVPHETAELPSQVSPRMPHRNSSTDLTTRQPHLLQDHHHHLQQQTIGQLQTPPRSSNGLHNDIPTATSSSSNTTSSAPAPPPPFLEEYNEDYMQSLQGYESLMNAQNGFLAPQFRAQTQPVLQQQQQIQQVTQQQQQQQQLQQHQLRQNHQLLSASYRPQRSQQVQRHDAQQQAHVQARAQAQVQSQSQAQHSQQVQAQRQTQQQQEAAQMQLQARARAHHSLLQQHQPQPAQVQAQTELASSHTLSETDFELFLTKYAEEFFTLHQSEYPESQKIFVQLCATFRKEREAYSDKRLKELLYKR